MENWWEEIRVFGPATVPDFTNFNKDPGFVASTFHPHKANTLNSLLILSSHNFTMKMEK
jgi:hypothetical protein